MQGKCDKITNHQPDYTPANAILQRLQQDQPPILDNKKTAHMHVETGSYLSARGSSLLEYMQGSATHDAVASIAAAHIHPALANVTMIIIGFFSLGRR